MKETERAEKRFRKLVIDIHGEEALKIWSGSEAESLAIHFSNTENKELKELLRRLYKNRAYNFSLEDIEEINKHLNNKP